MRVCAFWQSAARVAPYTGGWTSAGFLWRERGGRRWATGGGGGCLKTLGPLRQPESPESRIVEERTAFGASLFRSAPDSIGAGIVSTAAASVDVDLVAPSFVLFGWILGDDLGATALVAGHHPVEILVCSGVGVEVGRSIQIRCQFLAEAGLPSTPNEQLESKSCCSRGCSSPLPPLRPS